MTLDQLLVTLFSLTIWDVVKTLALVLLGLYLFFAFVVIRQVGLMTRALQVEFEWLIKIVAWAHFLFAVAVLFIAWSIL